MRPLFVIPVSVAMALSAAHAQDNPIVPPAPPVIVVPSPTDEPEVTLEELIRRAQANNPRLTIARESLEATRQRASASRAIQNPSLQLVPGFTGNREARDEDVILAQPLDLFGVRRARSQVFNAEVRRAEARNTLTQRALVVEVKHATAQLFAAQEAENLQRVQVEVAQLFRDAAARRAQIGDVPPVQVQRAELELLRLQNDLSNARSERLTRRAALNLLVSQEPNTPLRVALPLEAGATALLRLQPDASPVDPTNGEAPKPATSATVGGESVTGDVTTRPDIVGAQATLEARQAQARAVGRERLPSVELQARRSAFFGREGSYALRAVVTVPLFDFGAIKGERRAAEAEARAQEATLQQLRQQAASQRESARVALEQNRQNVQRYRDQLVPLTLDLLRKTQIGYAQGASTYLEVLEAQRTLRGIQTEYLQALVGAQNAETNLEAAINGGLPTPESALENSTLRGEAR